MAGKSQNCRLNATVTRCKTRGLTRNWLGNTLKAMSAINLKVNGKVHAVDVDPTTPLLYVLSDDLALNGPKFGCGLGQCGACTVIVKGQAIRSCITPVKSVEGAEIITLESLGTAEKPHPLQQAFIEEQAAQCGFCVNGVIMTAKAFLDKNPKASEQEIQQAMSGVLCRCFTHARMLQAINKYREGRAREAAAR
jgi:nicotinate dehydrogenase subunit A